MKLPLKYKFLFRIDRNIRGVITTLSLSVYIPIISRRFDIKIGTSVQEYHECNNFDMLENGGFYDRQEEDNQER